MKRIIITITFFLFAQLNMIAQSIDSVSFEHVLSEMVASLKEKSFEKFEKLNFEKENYFDLINSISGIQNFTSDEFDAAMETINQTVQENFQQIISKGEKKGLVWEKVAFDGYVCNTEEILIGIETKPKGFLVDSHMRLSYGDKKFTIIGIQLWYLNDEYKIKGDEIRGIFEIDLDIYVPADNMYLEEMESDGY